MRQHDGHGGPLTHGGALQPSILPPEAGPGYHQLKQKVAAGGLEVHEAIQLFFFFYSEREAMAQLIQERLGNHFLGQVLAGLNEGPVVTDKERLLAWQPTTERGAEGEAAWLLLAVRAGFAEARSGPREQLEQLVKGDQKIRSTEKKPGTRTVVGGKENWDYETYSIDAKDVPILSILVHLVRQQILSNPARKDRSLFELGVLMRKDPGYGGSDHTAGAAVDLTGVNVTTDDDVIEILAKMPPGKVAKVFPDNPGHMHLAFVDGGFEIGLPYGGAFFPESMSIEHKRAAAEKGAKPGATLHVTGLCQWSNSLCESTGTWDDTKQKWSWTKPAAGGSAARKHLKSDDVKQALADIKEAPLEAPAGD